MLRRGSAPSPRQGTVFPAPPLQDCIVEIVLAKGLLPAALGCSGAAGNKPNHVRRLGIAHTIKIEGAGKSFPCRGVEGAAPPLFRSTSARSAVALIDILVGAAGRGEEDEPHEGGGEHERADDRDCDCADEGKRRGRSSESEEKEGQRRDQNAGSGRRFHESRESAAGLFESLLPAVGMAVAHLFSIRPF